MKTDFAKLDRAFSPRCIAVVGDKAKRNFAWLRILSSFTGKLYSVQVNPKEWEGIKALGVENYTSLLDIPEPVDLVIVAVPRIAALSILEDCIRKDVAAAVYFTAGFSEIGTEEGKGAEELLAERAEQANFHLIGPNCMGIFNPRIGLKHLDRQYIGHGGPLGFISQSGTNAALFSLEAHVQGLDINKSVSFGNGVVLDSCEFLDYFGSDDEIKAIGMYLEGVREGRKFISVLKKVSARKPVVIWKGGRSEEGGRAIASHTGSMAIPQKIWEAAIRQSGAINVKNLEELIDTLKALLYLSPVRGNRVALAGGAGGLSVAITDAFVEAGLRVPALTKESYDEFETFFGVVGGSYRNPIDTGNPNRRFLRRIMEILDRDANIDNIGILVRPERRGAIPEQSNQMDEVSTIVEFRKKTLKPLIAVIPTSFTIESTRKGREAIRRLQEAHVPTFISLERGARALRNALDYYNFRK